MAFVVGFRKAFGRTAETLTIFQPIAEIDSAFDFRWHLLATVSFSILSLTIWLKTVDLLSKEKSE